MDYSCHLNKIKTKWPHDLASQFSGCLIFHYILLYPSYSGHSESLYLTDFPLLLSCSTLFPSFETYYLPQQQTYFSITNIIPVFYLQHHTFKEVAFPAALATSLTCSVSTLHCSYQGTYHTVL